MLQTTAVVGSDTVLRATTVDSDIMLCITSVGGSDAVSQTPTIEATGIMFQSTTRER